MTRCLFCYLPLSKGEKDFHATCSKKIFGQSAPPELPYDEGQMEKLAEQIVREQVTVTGVQTKLSLHIENTHGGPGRFTIVGLWGGYILKPPTLQYPQLPEVEDLTRSEEHTSELQSPC